jgi:HD-GYP domain-containing protein (c-di-GMP phosphodiesterase class II)
MSKKIDGFHSIRASTLVPDRKLEINVYISVEGRPVKYGAEGEFLDAERFSRLRKFKISKILIASDKEKQYRQYLENMLEQVEKDEKVNTATKASFFTGGAETAAEDVIQNIESKDIYTDAQAQFERFARFLQQHEGGFAEVIKLSGQVPNDYVAHGVQVAALTIVLCQNLKLVKNDEHLKSITTGCFIHDIAAERANLPLIFDKTSLSPEQRKEWELHPKKAVESFGNLNHVERQVLDIVWQHEEMPNGTGFPRGLKRKEMDPIACIVSLANRFDHYSTLHKGDKKIAIAEFFKSELGRYDLDHLELLRKTITQNS